MWSSGALKLLGQLQDWLVGGAFMAMKLEGQLQLNYVTDIIQKSTGLQGGTFLSDHHVT